jgi:hypothetical protein
MKDSTDGKGMLTYLDVIYIKQIRDPSTLLLNICNPGDMVQAISRKFKENMDILNEEKGASLLPNKKIKKSDFIIEYVGTLQKSEECMNSLVDKVKFGDKVIYFAALPNTRYCIDTEVYGNDARSINHNCNPKF